MDSTIPQAVLELRTHLGFDLKEFGAVMGVSRQSISYWERGIYPPSSTHLARLLSVARTSKAAQEILDAFQDAVGSLGKPAKKRKGRRA